MLGFNITGLCWVVLASVRGAELVLGALLSGAGVAYAGLAAVRGEVLLVGKVTFGGVVEYGVLAVEAEAGLVLLTLGMVEVLAVSWLNVVLLWALSRKG